MTELNSSLLHMILYFIITIVFILSFAIYQDVDSKKKKFAIVCLAIGIPFLLYFPLKRAFTSLSQTDIQDSYNAELSGAKEHTNEFSTLLKQAYFERGSPAALKVADMYHSGTGVHKDFLNAYLWYKSTGSFEGKYQAFQMLVKKEIRNIEGDVFYKELNLIDEEEKFEEYFIDLSKNQEKNNEDTCSKLLNISTLYLSSDLKNGKQIGIDIISNLSKNNYYPAQIVLAEMYNKGSGVISNPAKAYAWYLVSNKNNFSQSQYEQMMKLKSELNLKKGDFTESQLAELCAREFSKKNSTSCFENI